MARRPTGLLLGLPSPWSPGRRRDAAGYHTAPVLFFPGDRCLFGSHRASDSHPASVVSRSMRGSPPYSHFVLHPFFSNYHTLYCQSFLSIRVLRQSKFHLLEYHRLNPFPCRQIDFISSFSLCILHFCIYFLFRMALLFIRVRSSQQL